MGEENNNKVKKEKIKQKRKVSILTVFLWLLLIVVMSVITVSGIVKNNAVEGEPRKITVRVDFSEYFEKEGITKEESKIDFMETYFNFISSTNDIILEGGDDDDGDDDGYINGFITNEGNIGIYEVEIKNDDKYIGYHEANFEYYNLYKYSIESETNEIVKLNEEYDGGDFIYSYYGEGIKEEQNIYEVKLKNRLKNITVKVDFSEYFENEGIAEEDKIDVMEDYWIHAVKTNNLTKEIEYLENAFFVTNEGDIGIYEVEVTEEAKYIAYHYYNNLYKYNIESEKNEIIEIEEYDSYDNYIYSYYGEEIKEERDIYEVKLKKRKDLRTITIRVDFSEYFEEKGIIEEENKIDFMEYEYINEINILESNNINDYLLYVTFINNEENIGIYEVEITKEKKYIKYHSTYYNYSIEIKTNKIEYIEDNYKNETYYGEEIKEEQDIYEIKLKKLNVTDNTYITKQVKWIDSKKGIASIYLGYTSAPSKPVYVQMNGKGIYVDKLSEEFELSPEYYNDNDWTILDTTSDEKVQNEKLESLYDDIPLDVYNEFYLSEENSYTGKKYVYVKDTKTIYWFEKNIKPGLGVTNINVVYNGYDKLSKGIVVDTNKEARLFNYQLYRYDASNPWTYFDFEKYNISTPSLKYIHTQEGIIKVSKEIEEEGSNEYYVGIFENNIDSKTENIYEIKTENGKGDIVIEIPDYAKEKEYYIYEVDKEGNKIIDKNIKYSSNKMEFDKLRDAKIESDKNVVSSIMSDDWSDDKTDISKWHEYVNKYGYTAYDFETDTKNSKGTGEKDYIDNVLNVNDIYQASVTISSEKEEIKYKVEYVAEEGGTLEGEKEEIVAEGEKVENVPTPKSDKGYKFVRFEVEENGERVEVNPVEYVITKDTVFYAIFEPEEVIGLPNTSDINIWMYIGIFVIAIIVMIIVLLIINKNKKSKK